MDQWYLFVAIRKVLKFFLWQKVLHSYPYFQSHHVFFNFTVRLCKSLSGRSFRFRSPECRCFTVPTGSFDEEAVQLEISNVLGKLLHLWSNSESVISPSDSSSVIRHTWLELGLLGLSWRLVDLLSLVLSTTMQSSESSELSRLITEAVRSIRPVRVKALVGTVREIGKQVSKVYKERNCKLVLFVWPHTGGFSSSSEEIIMADRCWAMSSRREIRRTLQALKNV